MSDADSFKLVNHWFNRLVDENQASRDAQLTKLKQDRVLSEEQWHLLSQMLTADKDAELTLPDCVEDMTADWEVKPDIDLVNTQSKIGRYRLLEHIGSGGMGQVYLAERDDGSYHQQVAVKLSQHQFNDSMIKRFENERQILAQLTHPHIAQLLDGGTAANDQPYLVMDYIDGLSIDQYCIDHKLGLGERLQLIVQTCSAVSFAHQNLILHRDLKPQNILVNKEGQVKLLDFGIAKLLDEDQANQTMTQIMTRHYASPEQIKGEAVSTQSDLFSLAIITYELVSGFHPYISNSNIERDQNVLSGKIKKITQRNDKDQPQFPELALISRDKLAGDLEYILQKALAPDKGDRYTSVDAFSRDIQNFMANRPVTARKPSIWYMLRKAIQRQKLIAGLLLVTVMTLAGASVFSYNRALEAEKQTELAQTEAQKARAVADFLVALFDKSNPSNHQKELMVQDVLFQGFEEIDQDLTLNSEVKFELLHVIYRSLWNLGKHQETAETLDVHYAQCVEALSEFNTNCQNLLIGNFEVYGNNENFPKVLEALDQAEAIELARPEIKPGPLLYIYDTKLLTLMNLNRSEEGMEYGQKALALREQYFSSQHNKIRLSISNLALTYIQNKKFDEATELIKKVPLYLEKMEQDSIYHSAKANYYELQAFFHARNHESKKAAAYRKQAVDYSNEHFEVLSNTDIWTNRVLASELAKAGEIEAALEQYEFAEQLYKNQVTNNAAHLFRIYSERLIIYALWDNEMASHDEWQRLEALQYDYSNSDSYIKRKTVVDVLYHIINKDKLQASEKLQSLQQLVSGITAPDSIYPLYLLIAEGLYERQWGTTEQAMKKFRQAQGFWNSYPNFLLQLKEVVEKNINNLEMN